MEKHFFSTRVEATSAALLPLHGASPAPSPRLSINSHNVSVPFNLYLYRGLLHGVIEGPHAEKPSSVPITRSLSEMVAK